TKRGSASARRKPSPPPRNWIRSQPTRTTRWDNSTSRKISSQRPSPNTSARSPYSGITPKPPRPASAWPRAGRPERRAGRALLPRNASPQLPELSSPARLLPSAVSTVRFGVPRSSSSEPSLWPKHWQPRRPPLVQLDLRSARRTSSAGEHPHRPVEELLFGVQLAPLGRRPGGAGPLQPNPHPYLAVGGKWRPPPRLALFPVAARH